MAKVALITGASRGIGRATAEEFAKAGYQVAANFCSSGQAVEEFARQMAQQGCSVLPCQADVSDPQQVEQMVQTVLQQFGHIDVLVCNAGIARQGLLTDFTPEDWRRMMAVNLDGTFYCCRSVLPSMIHRHSGSIITTSSIWGLTGASCEVPYSAAKAGIIGLTKALAKEVGPSGIRVNCIAPGVVDTEMNPRAGGDGPAAGGNAAVYHRDPAADCAGFTVFGRGAGILRDRSGHQSKRRIFLLGKSMIANKQPERTLRSGCFDRKTYSAEWSASQERTSRMTSSRFNSLSSSCRASG